MLREAPANNLSNKCGFDSMRVSVEIIPEAKGLLVGMLMLKIFHTLQTILIKPPVWVLNTSLVEF